MKGRRFDTIEEIQDESQRVLETIPKRDFEGCFQAWQKLWDHCIRAKGEYFEGDGRNLRTKLSKLLFTSNVLELLDTPLYIKGGSNMTGTDLCVNKPHCAVAVRP